MKKSIYTLLLAGSCMLLASCGDKNLGGAGNDNSSRSDSQTESTSQSSEVPSDADTQPSEEASSAKTFEELIDELCGGHYVTDADGNSMPDTDYLPLPDFGAIPENSVFNVLWDTTEGSYSAGTSFLMQTDLAADPLLITAIHYFGEEEYISGSELADYVNGGELYDILKDGSVADGTISGVVPVDDAVAFGAVQTASKDLAAFTVSDASNMTALPVASEPCQPGDVIFLAAYLDRQTSTYYDDNLYPCIVISDDGTDIYYLLADEFSTAGASGGPLLNTKGEVVGTHMASSGSTRYGHSIQSIYEQLKSALSQ